MHMFRNKDHRPAISHEMISVNLIQHGIKEGKKLTKFFHSQEIVKYTLVIDSTQAIILSSIFVRAHQGREIRPKPFQTMGKNFKFSLLPQFFCVIEIKYMGISLQNISSK